MSDGELQVLFELERETKHTVRYKELTDPPVVGTLYVRKWVAKNIGDGKYPDKLLITLEVPT